MRVKSEGVKGLLEKKKMIVHVFNFLVELYETSPDKSIGVLYALGLKELEDKMETCRKHGGDCYELEEKHKALSRFKDIVVKAAENGKVYELIEGLHRLNSVLEAFFYHLERKHGNLASVDDAAYQRGVYDFINEMKSIYKIDVREEMAHLTEMPSIKNMLEIEKKYNHSSSNGKKPKF
jgi:hypothetical protein